MFEVKKDIPVFTNTEDLLNGLQTEQVSLRNYKNLFLIYLAFLSLVLVKCVVGQHKDYIKKLLSRFARRLTVTVRLFRKRLYPGKNILWFSNVGKST